MKDKICTSCGYEGKPVAQCKMSFMVDVALWITAINLVAFTALLPLLLIPAAWTTFHVIKFNSVKCPECESLDMVSKSSRKGKAAVARRDSDSTIWTADDHAASH